MVITYELGDGVDWQDDLVDPADVGRLVSLLNTALDQPSLQPGRSPFGDGRAAGRIHDIILSALEQSRAPDGASS